ncbi:hypothetical protein V494_02002 [Pseudogymnoascus sp. VKM F-4513 (FW-928)]|nr:hypothetical protein V494_02002 [Pseudogymnoascus sp. VKM F-4513 (FW-928)]
MRHRHRRRAGATRIPTRYRLRLDNNAIRMHTTGRRVEQGAVCDTCYGGGSVATVRHLGDLGDGAGDDAVPVGDGAGDGAQGLGERGTGGGLLPRGGEEAWPYRGGYDAQMVGGQMSNCLGTGSTEIEISPKRNAGRLTALPQIEG